ncbi:MULTISPECIES: EAL domain-containing protein [unclassified Duganella]|uniref:bifunctional diguanylate cyclase/phosphodiesterase n=1 Tax=unclassified Duganella TaxID=2636909 RepID=UPI0008895D72|nr:MULTISPECIES: EAL domain-containing protein [unclassified Duganella]SDF60215.1 PAS domain S-box-containing protein/diguanylate cyclase (GGDEF) domain-containing protein [Duganella sp. OV458]SDI68529.1 PAS domain S-box-containing protein/diguanylate cyclase (GGDEF) domain-containing protein [Duganella sp. OV510]
MSAVKETLRARWLRRGLDTHVSLPLFALLLLVAIWLVAFHEIDAEREHAEEAASDSLHEMLGTYEAQVARSIDGIDQTLRVLKYAVERKGALGALPELGREGLLPPGVVFVVSIVDRHGVTVASNPRALSISVADQGYFRFHQERDSGATFVSPVLRDAANSEWHLHFTRRLDDADGNFAGIVVVETDPAYFTSSYERSRLGERGMLGLVGTDGVVRALRTGDKMSFGQRLGISEGEVDNHIGGKYSGVRELHGIALNVLVGLDEQELMAGFEHRRREKLWEGAVLSGALVLVTGLLWLWSWQGARTRARMRRAQETYAAASAASLDAFFVMREMRDASGVIVDFRIVDANQRAVQMTGSSKQHLCNTTLCKLIPEARENGMLRHLVRVMKVGGMHEQEWQNTMPQLRARWLHQQAVAVQGGIVAIVRDISERKLAEERMLHLAHHDILTGLPNRSLIADRLDQTIAQARRNGGAVLVAFIDLDGFKLVNDGLGHNAGDELLKVVAQRMSGCLRSSDTVGRFGGDEFVLLLNEPSSVVDAAPVLERVREAVLQSVSLGGQEVQVSCSIGVAVYPNDGGDAGTLLMNADAAMYRAKELGKNNIQFYTREMNASIEEKLVLLEGLRNALDEGQFRLAYQPKVDLHHGRIFGVEALVRWEHPEHGVIGPDRFIPLAEESGMIVALGDWVLRTACAQNRAWQDAGLPPLRISVNVSPRQFEEPRLVERVRHALADSGLAPEWLELEVTEGLIMRDLQQAVAKMAEVKAMGVSLSIDDFGTGYSSLSALKSFPISTLKIDKSFVRDLGRSSGDEAIASSIIGLAHRLKLRVIAEGVETEQQRAFLRENGCDEMQGYLFSRPLPPEQLARLLAAPAVRAA